MNHDHHDSRMMWMMMLACALPLLVVRFIPALGRSPVVSLMVIVGGMFILHWLFMRPRRSNQISETKPKDPPSEHSTH